MSLKLPPFFENDIQGKDTALVPVVHIGNYVAGTPFTEHLFISTNQISLSDPAGTTVVALPVLLNIPSLKESIDIEKRNYKISSVNLDISNFPYEGKIFSDLMGNSSLINTEVRIFWVSPSANVPFSYDVDPALGDNIDNRAFQIYYGSIRRYTHDDEKVKLVVEDRSQVAFHKYLPLEKLTGNDVPDKYKGKKIPIVVGHVDRSPCVIGSADSVIEENGASFKILIDSKAINSVVHTKPLGNAPDPKGFLFIYVNNNYYRVLNDNTDVVGSFGSGVQAQILDEDIQFPDINGNSSVSMVARFDHEQAMNNLAKNSILVDIGRIPNSVNPYLIKLSDTDAGGGEPSDESDLNLISGELTNMYDMDESSLVHVVRHNVPSTNSSSDFRGMGFRFSFDSLGIDSEIIPDYLGNLTAYRIFTKFKFGCWGGELNLHWYNGTERKTFLQYNYGNSGYQEHLTIDNLFQTDSLTGYTAGTFDAGTGGIENTSDFNYYQFTWQDVNIDDPISIYQLSSLSTDDVNFDWDIYGFAVHAGFLIKEPQGRDYYANVKGRAVVTAADVTADVSLTLGDSPTAPSAIAHILNTELGQVNVGGSSLGYDWHYAFTVDKKINSKKLIEGIASASPYIPRFDNMGEFRFDVIPEKYTSPDRTIEESDVIDFSFSRTKIEDVYTRVVLNYNWDYAREEFNNTFTLYLDIPSEVDWGAWGETWEMLTVNVSGVEYGLPNIGYDYNYYGFPDPDNELTLDSESTLVIDDDRGKYIREKTTAAKFARWYLAWSCNQHLKMKVKLPLKYMDIEVGDIVDFNKVIGDVKPYGIDYGRCSTYGEDVQYYGDKMNGQQIYPSFIVTSTNKTLEWVEIECLQLHNLSDSEEQGDLCIVPEECVDNDALIFPLNCEGAVNVLGCDFLWEGVPISEICPVSCDACPEGGTGGDVECPEGYDEFGVCGGVGEFECWNGETYCDEANCPEEIAMGDCINDGVNLGQLSEGDCINSMVHIEDACSLPANSVHINPNGDILYNIGNNSALTVELTVIKHPGGGHSGVQVLGAGSSGENDIEHFENKSYGCFNPSGTCHGDDDRDPGACLDEDECNSNCISTNSCNNLLTFHLPPLSNCYAAFEADYISGCGILTSVNTGSGDSLYAGIHIRTSGDDDVYWYGFLTECGDGGQDAGALAMTSDIYPVITWSETMLQGSGDLNLDGKADISDLVLMGNYLSGDNDLDAKQFVVADVLRNNNVSILDIVNLANMIVGDTYSG